MPEAVLDVPIHLVIKGLRLAAALLDANKWPEDDWYAIDKSWDLNLWISEDDEGHTILCAAFYPATDTGQTVARDWQRFFRWTLYEEDISDELREKEGL